MYYVSEVYYAAIVLCVYIVYLASTMMQMSCVQCPEVYYTVIVLCPERVYWAANMLHISCALCPRSILECHCT